MKHKIPGVTDELLFKAKKEFLENGYANANLRKIASESGVSTNSIYGRFHDKAGLFEALVKEAADGLYSMIEQMSEAVLKESNFNREIEIENEGTMSAVDYIYDNLEAFQLIFCKSEGTDYINYLDKLSALEESSYKLHIEKIGKTAELNDFFIHAVVVSGYNYLYEMVAHNLTKQEAYAFIKKITEFRTAGWQKILG